MRVDAFDFDLPAECIALRPADPRDASRLLVVDPGEPPALSDRAFGDLPDLLRPNDLLVFNDTKVIAARLTGRRVGRGEGTPKIEVTLHRRTDASRWWCFAKPARKLQPGDTIAFSGEANVCMAGTLSARVEKKRDGGETLLSFELSGPVLDEAIAEHGIMPLPPYIASKRAPDERDLDDYQTVYASREGAVAAPTAGLHFTAPLLDRLRERGLDAVHVTLHVGAGTFLPVKAETTEDHEMHAEWGEVSGDVVRRVAETRDKGGRIVAVGTTSLRLLEAASAATGKLEAFSGETDIFITPGYRFRTADVLITNFHLPRSTLFMLVCAFSGTETMRGAYVHAVASGYRFYSYGDACLLNRAEH